MGYTTHFDGQVQIVPPLDEREIAYLTAFNQTRRMERTSGPYYVQGTGLYGQGDDPDITRFNSPPEGQPGLWCHWTPTPDGRAIVWDEREKFYDATDWMQYLIDYFLRPDALAKTQTVDGNVFFTFGDHILNGVISAQGEHANDKWFLVVEDNQAEKHDVPV